MVSCPICSKNVKQLNINAHIDSGCESFVNDHADIESPQLADFFRAPSSIRKLPLASDLVQQGRQQHDIPGSQTALNSFEEEDSTPNGNKRPSPDQTLEERSLLTSNEPSAKRHKITAAQRAQPLAERMRPRTLDEVHGQDLVGPKGVLRGLIESDRVPSMILWGGAGTGKTTIARVIAHMVGSRFIEINSTSSGVGECKKLFAEAKGELSLTGNHFFLPF